MYFQAQKNLFATLETRKKLLKLIGQLHDDVILLQLPESLSLLFSCAN